MSERPNRWRVAGHSVLAVGWVFLHPDGWVETDYFGRKRWDAKGKRLSREKWRRIYRSDCRMVRTAIVLPLPGKAWLT